MTFRISGLDPEPFAPLFDLPDAELAARGMRRRFADEPVGFPCRVSLDDAAVGDELVLLAYEHHAVSSPYRGSGPIYVRRAARAAWAGVDRVPPALLRRTQLSVRAYDAAGLMVTAAFVDGAALADRLPRLLEDPAVAYAHVHYGKTGCFAARVDRA
ncbi:MAG: DUF1203 domain-containing protein [Acidobacteriota bacterium]